MQAENTETLIQRQPSQAPRGTTSFKLAFALWLIAFAVCFVEVIHDKIGLSRFFHPSSLPIIMRHSAALIEYMASALGASTVFPILLVALFSINRTKRNPSTRRRIFIGWSLFVITLKLFTFLTAVPKLPS
jgi:hypothetical protein